MSLQIVVSGKNGPHTPIKAFSREGCAEQGLSETPAAEGELVTAGDPA